MNNLEGEGGVIGEKGLQIRVAGQFLLGIGLVMLTSDSILMLSGWADRWLSFLGCLALILLCGAIWGNCQAGLVARAAVAAGLAVFAWAGSRPGDPIARTVLVGWFFAFLGLADSRLMPRAQGRTEESGPADLPVYGSLHLATLLYALGYALYRRSDSVWTLYHHLAVSRLLPGAPVGVWAHGLPIYLLGAAILASGASIGKARFRQDMRRRLAGLAVLLAGCLLSAEVLRLDVPTTHLIVSWTQAASLVLVASVAGLVCPPRRSGGVTGVSLALTLASVVLIARPGATQPDRWVAGTQDRSRVSFAIYAAGLLDWRVPDSQALGLLNSGMFGLFRRSLEREAAETGGKVVVLGGASGPAITSESLGDAAAAIFINPTVRPSADEMDCLRTYVESGGGLLVLGDHTNIGGSRAALNAVLSFTGIRFNFDSAIPLGQHWQGCLEVRPHAVTRRLSLAPGSELRAQLAVGASVSVAGNARPLVLGRYGFADWGDSLNGGAGAFLGNMVRDRGERLGDLVLVAGQEICRGRVLVFGDTSPFQNGALFLSQELVSDAVTWVCRPVAGRDLALSPYAQKAGVDFSLHPRARVQLFTDGSLGGLVNCLARLGIAAHPIFSRNQWDDAGRYLFLVAPTRMCERDTQRLLHYIDGGGNLIICQGHAEPQPCRDLLERLGLAITGIPLGNGDQLCQVAHKDAWALACAVTSGERLRPGPVGRPVAGDTTVLASALGYPTVVVRPCGRGSLTLVGDGGLLLDDNLEGERTAVARNVAFLGDLLDLLDGAGHQLERGARAQPNPPRASDGRE